MSVHFQGEKKKKSLFLGKFNLSLQKNTFFVLMRVCVFQKSSSLTYWAVLFGALPLNPPKQLNSFFLLTTTEEKNNEPPQEKSH